MRARGSIDGAIKYGFSGVYISKQEVLSATWLKDYKAETSKVFADSQAVVQALTSYALIPDSLLPNLTNDTIPSQGDILYLNNFNLVNGIISYTDGSFNTSEISYLLTQNNLIYSNGDIQMWYTISMP